MRGSGERSSGVGWEGIGDDGVKLRSAVVTLRGSAGLLDVGEGGRASWSWVGLVPEHSGLTDPWECVCCAWSCRSLTSIGSMKTLQTWQVYWMTSS